jgi:hypothetical protein
MQKKLRLNPVADPIAVIDRDLYDYRNTMIKPIRICKSNDQTNEEDIYITVIITDSETFS